MDHMVTVVERTAPTTQCFLKRMGLLLLTLLPSIPDSFQLLTDYIKPTTFALNHRQHRQHQKRQASRSIAI